MGVTLKDVAREAQVSTATVSRVINGAGNVSQATRERMRMDVLQRKIAKCEPYAPGKPLEQQLQGRLRLPAVRTLEITVLDERHGRVLGAHYVIDRRDRDRELEVARRRHARARARAAAGGSG